MKYAPIVVFAFNRLDVLKNTILSLAANPEAKDSELFVFVDGPRPNKEGEAEKVKDVRDYVKTIVGFKKINYKFSEYNKGLAKSIISGTSEIIEQYGKIIVIEDDLYVSKSFLRFMNAALDLYENCKDVMQVSGYGCLQDDIKEYAYDAYLNLRARSWTWATWQDRWDTVDWDVRDYECLKSSYSKRRAFNRAGTDLYKMLKGFITGKNNSWYIRFAYSMHKQGKYSLQPIKSLVRNDGFGVEATHCTNYNRYKIDFEIEHIGDFNLPTSPVPNYKLIKNARRFYTIKSRLVGKIMTILLKFK